MAEANYQKFLIDLVNILLHKALKTNDPKDMKKHLNQAQRILFRRHMFGYASSDICELITRAQDATEKYPPYYFINWAIKRLPFVLSEEEWFDVLAN